MVRKINDVIVMDFTTHDPNTGGVSDTDIDPTCEVFEDDNDVALLTITAVKRVAKTGDYRVTIPATALNGFSLGSSYNVIASATVGGISAKGRIGSFTIDSVRTSDVYTAVELIRKLQTNRWKIVGNQMIMYNDDQLTPILTLNLTNAAGNPSMTEVYERVPV